MSNMKWIRLLFLLTLPCWFSGEALAAFATPAPQGPPPATDVTVSDYTAFPPFLPRVVSPNILFMLDYSKSMVRPAYGTCDSSLSNCRTSFSITADDFNSGNSYSGYFDEGSKYSCSSGNAGSCSKNAAGGWDGKWLNWLTMTQFDVLKKVVVGGDITASPEQGNPTKLRSLLVSNVPIVKSVALDNCSGKTPDCTNWPAIAYDVNYFNSTGATIITKETNTVPATADAMALQKLYKVSASYTAGDEGLVRIPLPFTFKFFDTNYTTIFAHSNGLLSFDFNTANRQTYSFIADTYLVGADSENFNNLIAPYWDDLDLSLAASKIWYKTFGSAPNRVFAITYEEATLYPSTSYPNGGATFQVLLYEGSNHVVFQYKDLTLTDASNLNTAMTGSGAIAGVENATGTKGKVYSNYNQANLAAASAAFMSTHIAYSITPDASTPTTFKTMAPLPTTGSDYHVNINLNNTAKVGGACPAGYTENKFNKNCYDHLTDGLLQEFRDGELSGLLGFRLGIMELDNGQLNGGKVVKHFNEKDTTGWASLMAATRGRAPSDAAPIGEALYEATGYFRQNTSYMIRNGDWTNHGTGATCAATGNNYDPFCFQSAAQKVPCAKSYVLLVSAGNYSNDYTTNIFGDAANAESWANDWSLGWRSTGETGGQEGTKANGGWADNVAYKLHTTDLRPDATEPLLPGAQSVGIYAVNTFGAGSGDGTEILKRIAKYGGFIDNDGDGNYDSGEDDKNNNSVPDTYFQASGGGDLRAQIVNAVMDILKNSASGTSVSVLSTSAGGEGALYQAYFYPAKVLNDTEERRWPGYLRAFFIDRYQNLRDDHSNTNPTGDSAPDAELVLNEDRVVTMFLSPQDNSVRLDLQRDINGDGMIKNQSGVTETTKVVSGIPMDDVASLWEGGAKLASQEKDERHIYLWLDRDGDGIVDDGGDFSDTDDGSETIELSTSVASDLIPYFRAKDQIWDTALGLTNTTDTSKLQESENLINFILGKHIETNVDGNHHSYRNRCIYVADPSNSLSHETGCVSTNAPTDTAARVWPLGDIVFSTPTLVAGPSERYDKIYSDTGYIAFRNLYQSRRNVVYVGANDGMLHAFNAGVYKQGDNSDTSGVVEFGRFLANPSSGNGWTDPVPELGDELWAFLPHDNLPHIPWLVCNGSTADASACYNTEYTHVYYVDHRPKVTDVRIFNDSATGVSGQLDGQADASHPNGWGTILILPLRLGGGAMNVDLNGDGDISDAGEQSFRSAYYIFDITNPEKPPKLLRRFTNAALGFSTSYPAIARLKSGSTEKWFMVVGSGPENKPPGVGSRAYGFSSSIQDGKIFVVDLMDGSTTVLDADSTIAGYQVMSDPTVIDVNLDFSVDVIYIGSTITPSGTEEGDTFGRIYRINTNGSTTPSSWVVSKFFDVNPAIGSNSASPDDNQEMGPLVAAPSASKDATGKLWIYFGTGQLRNRYDMTNSRQQRFYAVKDNCWKSSTETGCPATYGLTTNELMNTTNVTIFEAGGGRTADQVVQIQTAFTGSACDGSSTGTQCSWDHFLGRVRQKQGWYKDLDNPASAPSEKSLSKASILGGVVLFTTYQPSGDLCSIFGDSVLRSVYYETGTAYPASVIGSYLVDSSGNVLTDAAGNPLKGDDYTRNASGQLVRKNPDGTETAAPSGAQKTFLSEVTLGQGMPTSVGLAVGETTTGFVQQSTGEIVKVKSEPVFKIKSGPTSWHEQPTGGSSPGLEMIYRHISK